MVSSMTCMDHSCNPSFPPTDTAREKMAGDKVSFYRWNDMPKEKVTDLLERRLVTGDRMMLAHVYLKKGCRVPLHKHENEQLTYILEGALHFWIGDDKREEIIL